MFLIASFYSDARDVLLSQVCTGSEQVASALPAMKMQGLLPKLHLSHTWLLLCI